MTSRIVRQIGRAAPHTIQQLGGFGVSTIHEALGRTGLLRSDIRPLFDDAIVAGSAITVLCTAGDNLMLHAAMSVAQPGDVLVVATTTESDAGMFGELLAQSCGARGVAGLVIDAGVRDVAEIAALKFPVWAKSICAQGTSKTQPGTVNVAITCAGQRVQPGDVVVADRDGVVIVPRADATQTVERAAARHAQEAQYRARLRAGELGLDVHSLRDALSSLGTIWVDEEPESSDGH